MRFLSFPRRHLLPSQLSFIMMGTLVFMAWPAVAFKLRFRWQFWQDCWYLVIVLFVKLSINYHFTFWKAFQWALIINLLHLTLSELPHMLFESVTSHHSSGKGVHKSDWFSHFDDGAYQQRIKTILMDHITKRFLPLLSKRSPLSFLPLQSCIKLELHRLCCPRWYLWSRLSPYPL